jgi:hypothetical protein
MIPCHWTGRTSRGGVRGKLLIVASRDGKCSAQGPRLPTALPFGFALGVQDVRVTKIEGRICHGFFHWAREQLLNIGTMYLVDLCDTVVVTVKHWVRVRHILASGFFPEQATQLL